MTKYVLSGRMPPNARKQTAITQIDKLTDLINDKGPMSIDDVIDYYTKNGVERDIMLAGEVLKVPWTTLVRWWLKKFIKDGIIIVDN